MLLEVRYAAQLRRGGLLYKTLNMGASSIEFGDFQAIGRAFKKAEVGGIKRSPSKSPTASETQPEPLVVQMQQLSGTKQA